jgi:hypothetical protein
MVIFEVVIIAAEIRGEVQKLKMSAVYSRICRKNRLLTSPNFDRKSGRLRGDIFCRLLYDAAFRDQTVCAGLHAPVKILNKGDVNHVGIAYLSNCFCRGGYRLYRL